MDIKNYEINWNRSIQVKGNISDSLVEELSGHILKLRQENSEPITLGIDSYGGSLSSMQVLLSLLGGADQKASKVQVIGVAINNAFSSAANLLALSDYAVAYQHSSIIFHDVRFQGIDDVTPEKALSTAKQLSLANDEFSLKLAKKIVSRLVWVYLALKPKFEESKTKLPLTTKKFKDVLTNSKKKNDPNDFDIVGFGVTIYRYLSKKNDHIIVDVFSKLTRWQEIQKNVKLIPLTKVKGSRKPGLLDGVIELHKLLCENDETPGIRKDLSDEDKTTIQVLLTLCALNVSKRKGSSENLDDYLEKLVHDYNFVKNMNDEKHLADIFRIMSDHSSVFFDKNHDAKNMTSDDLLKAHVSAFPHVRIFWYFCVLLCRSLFDGEHRLTAWDAQLLGIVDEVTANTVIQSRREFLMEQKKTKK